MCMYKYVCMHVFMYMYLHSFICSHKYYFIKIYSINVGLPGCLFKLWPHCVKGLISNRSVGGSGGSAPPSVATKTRFDMKKVVVLDAGRCITSAAITPVASVTAALCRHLSPPPPPLPWAKNSSHHPAHHVRACVRSHLLPTPTSFLFSLSLPSTPHLQWCDVWCFWQAAVRWL